MTSLYLSLAVLTACQVQSSTEPTGTASQELSAYCGATMPATPYWNGQSPPKAADGQIFLLYRDPAVTGEWVGVLADPGKGALLWGARLKAGGSLNAFVDSFDNAGQLDIGRIPPPPGPIGPSGVPPFLLEWATRTVTMQSDIEAAAVCK